MTLISDIPRQFDVRHSDIRRFGRRHLNVCDFGARGDGYTLDTQALNAAIERCESAGGGRVVVPQSTYCSGPIQLRSGVELHLEAGAVVQFSRDFDQFPLCVTFYEGQKTVQCRSPLWGENLRDVAITGSGTFDGQGQAWRPVKKAKMTPAQWAELRDSGGVIDESRGTWWPTIAAMQGETLVRRLRLRGPGSSNEEPSNEEPSIEQYAPARDFMRPNMVQITNCRGVTLDGPTFRNSPAWNIHLLMCEDVVARHITVLNPWWAQNGDGIDIESCRNVEISECTLDVGDDAICLKSGKDAEGRLRNRPCENITVRNCRVLHGHGGLVIGSEMSGGVRDVRVSNCDFQGTDVGLRFKTVRGRGGTVENIDIRDIQMSQIQGAAISFDMFYSGTAWGEGEAVIADFEPVSEATPQLRDVFISKIRCEGAKIAIEIRGLPEMPVEGLTIENMFARSEKGVKLQDVRNIVLRDIDLEVEHFPALEAHNVEKMTLVNFNCKNSDAAQTTA